MEDHKVMRVEIPYVCQGKTLMYYTHVMAVSKYHAIEKAYGRCKEIQADRSKYKVVSVRSREMAQCMGFLAMAAISYVQNYS
jgi:hypothetical protein